MRSQTVGLLLGLGACAMASAVPQTAVHRASGPAGVTTGANGQWVVRVTRSSPTGAVGVRARSGQSLALPGRGAGLPSGRGGASIHDRRPPARFTGDGFGVVSPRFSALGPDVSAFSGGSPRSGTFAQANLAGDTAVRSVTSGFGEASSFSLAAAYNGSQWSLGLSISSSVSERLFWDAYRPIQCGWSCPPWWSWSNYGWSSWYPYYSVTPINVAPSYGSGYGLDPNLNPYFTPDNTPDAMEAAANPEPEPTPLERAATAIEARDFDAAARALREQLDLEPGDAPTERLMAMVLLFDRKLPEGFRAMQRVYERDPALADRPFDYLGVGLTRRQFESLTSPAMTLARSQGAAGAISSIAILQSRGQTAHALSVLDSASKAGVTEEVSARFRQALER